MYSRPDQTEKSTFVKTKNPIQLIILLKVSKPQKHVLLYVVWWPLVVPCLHACVIERRSGIYGGSLWISHVFNALNTRPPIWIQSIYMYTWSIQTKCLEHICSEHRNKTKTSIIRVWNVCMKYCVYTWGCEHVWPDTTLIIEFNIKKYILISIYKKKYWYIL